MRNEPGSPISVLLVEDEEALLDLLGRVLRQSGFTIYEADSSEQALELWAKHAEQIDVLATDVMMAQMNGFELAEQLRKSKPELNVICMTGYSTEMLKRQIDQNPDYNILQKPFRPRDLANLIRGTCFFRRGPELGEGQSREEREGNF
ncbi:MAG: response regulator [Blastochloris sp.]|nr:response regulator [Blastochloris sp.]